MIVTAIDRPYLPGLKALHNSIKQNSPGMDVACIVYGDDALADEVACRGIWVLHNPPLNVNLPTTKERYPVGNPAMYCRLMIPKWFDCDAVWLDADQVVLKPLDPLFAMGYREACAAVMANAICDQVDGSSDKRDALYAGLIHFNRVAWNEQNVTERCFEIMNTSQLGFKYVVQSVLSLALGGDFHHLGSVWQNFGNRLHQPIERDARVVHWHGYGRNPWTCVMPNNELWLKYAE